MAKLLKLGIVILATITTLVSADIVCPAATGTNYTTLNRQVFNITCGYDGAGSNLQSPTVATFAACVELCSKTSSCAMVSYVGTTCYMKTATTTPPTANGGSNYAVLWYTLPALSCPNSNQSVYNTANGGSAIIECFQDHAGGDGAMTIASTMESCITTCSLTSGCVAVSYAPGSGGACYLKNTLNTAVTNNGVWGARFTTNAAPAGSAFTVSCPQANGQTVTDSNNATWTIECQQDRAGGDYEQLYFGSLNACMTACSSQLGCVGVSWVPGQNGKCYLKNLQGVPAVANAAVWGARIAANATVFPPLSNDVSTCANTFFIGSPGCGNPLPAGVTKNQLTSQLTMTTRDGRQRTYYYYIPTGYDPTKPSKMLISYHGQGDSAYGQAGLTQFTNSAINTNFIAIFPDGWNNTDGSKHWQGAPYQTAGVDDVAFTQQLIGLMSNTFCVDPSRIYASGHSNGGGMVGVLACDPNASRLFAAFGANSGAFYTAPAFANPSNCLPDTVYNVCNPGRSRVPILEVHGDADGQIAYGGGPHNSNCMPALIQYMSQWAVRDGFYANNTYSDTQLLGMATTTNLLNSTGLTMAVQYQWGTSGIGQFGNPGGIVGEVTHIRVPGWGHAWPNGGQSSNGFSTAPVMLTFFNQWNLFTG